MRRFSTPSPDPMTMMPTSLHRVCAACAAVGASLLLAGTAQAAIVGSTTDVDFTGGSHAFTYLGQTFTLRDNGSGFPSAISASTAGTAMLAKDFFGISVFFDPPRNYLFFDNTYQYASYPSATVLSFSSLPTLIGLSLSAADGTHYGYAEFSVTLFEGYAFESTPNVGILAGAALVPEPESIALLGLGLGALALSRRKRR